MLRRIYGRIGTMGNFESDHAYSEEKGEKCKTIRDVRALACP